MFNWYILTIIALFSYGFQYFLYNVSAKKKCNSAWTSFAFMGTVAILSFIFFLVSNQKILNIAVFVWLVILSSVTYLAFTISRMETFKNIPVSVASPIIKMSIVLVMIFSLTYFKEQLSLYQIIGAIFAIIVIFVLTKQKEEEKIRHPNFKLGIILAMVTLIIGAISTIIVKFVTVFDINFLGFMLFSYILNALLSLVLIKRFQTEKEDSSPRNAVRIGISIGLVNFIGFYAFMTAVSLGPLSLISPICGMSFVVTIVLSVFIYKEKLNLKRILGIILAVLAVILMGL